MPAMEPANLLRFLRKLKEVFDVCDEDADGFIRVEHFVALGLQFGQGDEVSGATPGPAWPPRPARPCLARCSGPPQPPASTCCSRCAGSGSRPLPPGPPVTHLPSWLPRFSPSLSDSLLPSGRPGPPPVPQGVPEPSPRRPGAPSPQGHPVALPLSRRVLPKDSPDPSFPQGVVEPPLSLWAAQTPRASLAPGPLGWSDPSLSGLLSRAVPLPEVLGGGCAFRGGGFILAMAWVFPVLG